MNAPRRQPRPEPLPADPFNEGALEGGIGLLYKVAMAEPLTDEESARWKAYEKAQADAVKRRDRLGMIDLAQVMREGVTKPTMLVDDLLVEAKHHLIYGTKEVSKTWIVLWAIAGLISDGRKVVYVDKESGKGEIAERLLALGVSPDTVSENLTYLEFPSFDLSAESVTLWEALLALTEPALVAFDAQTEFLADGGLNENSGTDLERFAQSYLTPAHRLGAATLMIDHVGHSDQNRSRGTGQKGNAAKVELLVTKGEPFSRTSVGHVTVTRTKNTPSADIPAKQTYELGGEEGAFVFRRVLAPRDDPKQEKRDRAAADLKARITETLAEADGPLSQNQLFKLVGGRRADTIAAMEELARSGLSRVTMRPKGTSMEYLLSPADAE